MAEVNQEKQSSGNIPADLTTSKQAELNLNVAAEKLDRLLAEKGITEDELMREFHQLRKEHNLK